MQTKRCLVSISLTAWALFSAATAGADPVSPGVRDRGKVYSKEPADTSTYGNGPGGRAMEAMMLRFDVERLMQDGNIEAALPKAYKAVQLDPADPTTRMMLVRLLTRKFYSKKGPVDEKLMLECMSEWKVLWHHDADQTDQAEAKYEYLRMAQIERALDRQHELEDMQAMEQEEKIAARSAAAAGATSAAATGGSADASERKQAVADNGKRKHLGLF